jgi:lysophospholipase-3
MDEKDFASNIVNQRVSLLEKRTISLSKSFNESLSPILLVPGYSGMHLNAYLNNAQLPEYCLQDCPEGYRLWIDDEFLSPFRSKDYEDCWYRSMNLDYDNSTRTYYSVPGLKVLPEEYCGTGPGGGTYGSDYLLDVWGYGLESYFGNLIEQLESIGYKRAANLRSANYDWRVSPDTFRGTFYVDLKALVEKMSAENGGKKIQLVAHSLGNLVTVDFLSTMTSCWKEKYIKKFVSVSAPWGGASKSLRDLLSGDNIIGNTWYNRWFDIFNRVRVAHLGQNFGAITFLLPTYTLWEGFPLVEFTSLNQTLDATMIDKIFGITGNIHPRTIYNNIKDILPNIQPPGVDLHCIVGSGIETEKRYVYNTPEVMHTDLQAYCGNGDGTVPQESLSICNSWATNGENKGKLVTYQVFNGREHTGILNDGEVIQTILALIN